MDELAAMLRPPPDAPAGRPGALPEGAGGYSPYPLDLVSELDTLTRERHARPKGDTPAAADARQKRIDDIVAQLKGRGSPVSGDIVVGIRLGRIVGKGNFGVVWQGIDVRTGEVRAVKVFDSDRLGLDLALVHFRRGVTAMAHLKEAMNRPPSVVELFEREGSDLAFSMPYLEGGSLVKVKQRGWDPAKKLRVFRTICEAAGFAHDNKVVHRDIKPANIVMTSAIDPVLTDFDIADLLFVQTMFAQAAGTPCYAAPEQLHEDDLHEPSSPSADIYSLGRLLYYLLLERDPKLRVDVMPQLDDLAGQPEGLVRIVRKCTMEAPKERYASVAALLQDLDRHTIEPEAVGQGFPRLMSPPISRLSMWLIGITFMAVALFYMYERLSPIGKPVRSSLAVDCKEVTDQTGFVIGEYNSIGGAERNFGKSSHNGVSMAVKQINDAGGVNGKQVRLVSYDDRGDPDQARQQITEVIACGALAVVGEVASSLSIAGGEVCEKLRVPMISPSSTSTDVTKDRNYVFRACFTNEFQGYAMAKFMTDKRPDGLGVKRAMVLIDKRSQQQSYSRELANIFENNLKMLKGEVVGEVEYDGKQNFSSLLSRVSEAKPEALYIPGYYADVVEIAKGLPRDSSEPVYMLGGDGWESVAKDGDGALDGAYYSSHFAPDAPRDPLRPEVQKFVDDYEKMFNEMPNALAALGYDTMMLLKDAIARAPVDDNLASWRNSVREAIARTMDFQGVTGKITPGDIRKPAVVLEIQAAKKGAVYRAKVPAP